MGDGESTFVITVGSHWGRVWREILVQMDDTGHEIHAMGYGFSFLLRGEQGQMRALGEALRRDREPGKRDGSLG